MIQSIVNIEVMSVRDGFPLSVHPSRRLLIYIKSGGIISGALKLQPSKEQRFVAANSPSLVKMVASQSDDALGLT